MSEKRVKTLFSSFRFLGSGVIRLDRCIRNSQEISKWLVLIMEKKAISKPSTLDKTRQALGERKLLLTSASQ